MIFQPTTPTKEKCECSTSTTSSSTCPTCKTKGLIIKEITIKSQLKKELLDNLQSPIDQFSFCTNPKCDTVYYSQDGDETYNQKDIKSKVTIKNNHPKTPLCYCRKLLKEKVVQMIENREENIVDKIKTIISDGKSFCEKSNPKGVCCTEDIKDFLKTYDIEWEKPSKSLFSATPPASSCC